MASSHQRQSNVRGQSRAGQKSIEDVCDILDLAEIKNLSTMQLRTIMAKNCVDYKGITEKEELWQKVTEIWIDYHTERGRRRAARRESRANNNSSSTNSNDSSSIRRTGGLDESLMCKICMEREINCVLLECGHMISCIDCSKQFSDCPICRRNVIRRVRTFRG